MARLFISQERIDRLAEGDRIVVDGDRMEIPALHATFTIRPAVYFLRVVTEEGDPHGLVGKVKTEEQLRALAAEHFEDSVLLGEVAYECENGFVGEVHKSATPWVGQLDEMPE